MRSALLSCLCISISFCAIPTSAAWVNATGNLAGMASECGNMCLLSPVPGKAKVIAGIAQKGLWATTDGGATWTKLGSGAGSATITNRTSWIEYDPTNPDIFWESGIYNGGGVYKTTDGGVTFTQLGTIGHNDYVSIDFSDPNRQTLLAGGHEQSNKVYKSVNGGTSWTEIGANVPSGTNFSSYPVVINSTTFLLGCAGWGSGTSGVYRSTDAGATWTSVTTKAPTAPPLITSNGTIYFCLIWDNGLIKSTNQGQTWTQPTGSGAIKASHPMLMPNGNMLAVGTNKIVTSTNGATWTQIADATPFQGGGVIFEPVRSAFYIWQADCTNAVKANAIARFDYTAGTTIPVAKAAIRAKNSSVMLSTGSAIQVPSIAKGLNAVAYDLTGKIIEKRVMAGSEKSIQVPASGVSIVKFESPDQSK